MKRMMVVAAAFAIFCTGSLYAGSGKMQKVPCSFCNGTGYNPAKEYPPSFGNGRQSKEKRCEICGSFDVHYHKKCPSCQGKKYELKVIP